MRICILLLKQNNKGIRKVTTLEYNIRKNLCFHLSKEKPVLVPLSKTTIEWDVIYKTNVFCHYTICSLGLWFLRDGNTKHELHDCPKIVTDFCVRKFLYHREEVELKNNSSVTKLRDGLEFLAAEVTDYLRKGNWSLWLP